MLDQKNGKMLPMSASFHSGTMERNTRSASQMVRLNHGVQLLSSKIKVGRKQIMVIKYKMWYIIDGKYVPSKKGGENWWGYCGNCKGEVDKRCKAGGHIVLKDTWRGLKG